MGEETFLGSAQEDDIDVAVTFQGATNASVLKRSKGAQASLRALRNKGGDKEHGRQEDDEDESFVSRVAM